MSTESSNQKLAAHTENKQLAFETDPFIGLINVYLVFCRPIFRQIPLVCKRPVMR